MEVAIWVKILLMEILFKSKVFIHTKAVEKYWKSRNLTQLRAWTSRPCLLPQNYLTTRSDTIHLFYINIQYPLRMKQFHSSISTFQKKSSQTWPSSTIASCTTACSLIPCESQCIYTTSWISESFQPFLSGNPIRHENDSETYQPFLSVTLIRLESESES